MRNRPARLAALAVPFAGAAAAGLILSGVVPAAAHQHGAAKATTIRVVARDFRFVLSRTQVPAGAVRFVVVNRGSIVHDFALGRAKTRLIAAGRSAVRVVRLTKPGRYTFLCTVSGHAALGMKGTLIVTKGKTTAPPVTTTTTKPETPPTQQPGAPLAATRVGTFDRPVLVTSPPGDPERLFVVEQAGVVRVLDDGVLQGEPFLDISGHVKVGNEAGLLSLAFAPDYATSGRFYVYYTARQGSGDVKVVEYRRDFAKATPVADLTSARVVLEIPEPYENHKAGMMQFGPDGNLYIAVGDGDSGVANPPGAFAQTLDDLLGSILRIEPHETANAPYTVPDSNPFVGVEGARPEIWSFGLRNPWRFWIDSTGDLYIADVGEGAAEEIDLQPAGHGGLNFGWPCYEGRTVFDASARCPNAVFPLFDYPHAHGECSVIGGVVMHDARLPELDGLYLYADLCIGELKALRLKKGSAPEEVDLGVTVSQPTSFGVDALGRVYVTTLDGPVYRLDRSA